MVLSSEFRLDVSLFREIRRGLDSLALCISGESIAINLLSNKLSNRATIYYIDFYSYLSRYHYNIILTTAVTLKFKNKKHLPL
jgi:hypothetical protein